MSNLKFYDNGSLTAAGNVATGHSSNLLLGNCNVAARYKVTYVVGPTIGNMMYIENGIYYFFPLICFFHFFFLCFFYLFF